MALSGEERAWLDDRPEPAPPRPEILDAGFTHCDATGGIGFAGGGMLDKMPAGQELASCADRAWDAGLRKWQFGMNLPSTWSRQKRAGGPM